MQILERDGFTAEQVEAKIRDALISPEWGVDLLHPDGSVAEENAEGITGCTVSHDNYADVHGSIDLTIRRALDWEHLRARPYQVIGGARFDLGVYGLQTPTQNTQSGSYTVKGYDMLYGLQRKLIDTRVIEIGQGRLDEVRLAVADSGVTGVQVLLDSTAQADVTDEPMVWPFDAASPYTYLRVVSDLLASTDPVYRGLWAGPSGNLRAEPYSAPALRPIEWVLDTTDSARDITTPQRTVSVDNYQRTNYWVFVRTGMTTRPTSGDGVYIVDRSGGGEQVPATYAIDAPSQASLVSQADRIVEQDSARVQTVELSMRSNPAMWHFDVMSLVTSDGASKVQARSWKHVLEQATSELTVEVVDG